MKYYTLLALFLVLGISRTCAQSDDQEPKRILPNHKAEFQAMQAKEAKLYKVDPNSTLDATAKRQKLMGGAPASAPNARKATPAARVQRAAVAGKNPSDISSTDAAKANAARKAQEPKIVAPVLEQERVGPGNAPAVTPKSTSIPKH